MTWSEFIRPAQRRFRRSRAELIKQLHPEIEGALVVDLGGSLSFWAEVKEILKPGKVIIYNISPNAVNTGLTHTDDIIEAHLYDGKRVPMEDGSADFVLCNSVIEHVPPDQREGLAQEIKRIGRHYVVQTPSKSFPLELHFGLPFMHWLPRPMGRKLAPLSPFGAMLSKSHALRYFDETQLLPYREFQSYFPEAKIHTERFLGLPKSNIAVT